MVKKLLSQWQFQISIFVHLWSEGYCFNVHWQQWCSNE